MNRLFLGALLVLTLSSCSKKDSGDPTDAGVVLDSGSTEPVDAADEVDHEGLQLCCILGAVCHPADDGDGPTSTCHDVGHQNEPDACRAQFDACFTACTGLSGLDDPDAGDLVLEPHACTEELESSDEHHEDEEHHHDE